MIPTKYIEGDLVVYTGMSSEVEKVMVNRSYDPERIEYRIRLLAGENPKRFIVPENDLSPVQEALF